MSRKNNTPHVQPGVLPPHSIPAEQGLIGGLLLDNQFFDRVIDVVKVQHFYDQAHRLIYQAMFDLYAQNKAVDLITVADSLAAKGTLEQAGGFAYLAEVANGAISTAAISSYAKIIRSKAVLRHLGAACNRILQTIHDPGTKKAEEILDEAEALMLRVTGKIIGQEDGPVPARDFVGAVFRDATAVPSPNGLQGLSTGLSGLDQITLGLCPADFIVIGARPSHGKTTLALNIAEEVGLRRGLPVLIFSPEMPKEQLSLRMLSSMSGIKHSTLRTRNISAVEKDVFASSLAKLSAAPIYIDDSARLDANALRARARRTAKKAGSLALVIVDYIQLMATADEVDNATRNLEVQGISRSIKALAKELQVPVIAVSQLNRSVDRRSNQRPILSDLRDSGSIEQDADVIIFLYREGATKSEEQSAESEAELIVAKQRNGPIGSVKVLFKPETLSFRTLPRKEN